MISREGAGVQTHIVSVEAYVLAGSKDYAGDAGLKEASGTSSLSSHRSMTDPGDLHICVYPSFVQTCLIKITTSDGQVGWGEAHAPIGARATKLVVEDILAPLLIGQDPLAIERHWERMYGSMRLRGHVAGFQLEAISGIDIALWDLAGKLLDLPVYRLLGGPYRTEIPVYASGIPGTTVEERLTSAHDLMAQGYTTLKASIGRGSIESDLAVIASLVTATKGRADLLVDAHGAYSSENGMYVGRQLQDMGVTWLEDPLPPEDIDGYVRLSGELDMAIAAGETECTRWQFAERLSVHAVDVILPDICRAGGITEGRKIATVASLHNVRWAAHVSMGSSVHVAAAAHLGAASANFLVLEFPSTPNPLGEPLLVNQFHPERGFLQLSNAPGLGIEFDEVLLEQHIRD
jgi:D-galactarolactone cycloisomerase